MAQMPPGRVGFVPLDNRAFQNQPTSSADSAGEEVVGDADEPPDERQLFKAKPASCFDFKKSACPLQKRNSILTKVLHSSESDSHQDEDDSPFFDAARAQSSASTYSQSSVVSMPGLTSGLDSPARTGTPSPPLPPLRLVGVPPVFNHKPFETPASGRLTYPEPVGPKDDLPVDAVVEQKVEVGLGRKRCITFACGRKDPPKQEAPPRSQSTVEVKSAEPPKRQCTLKFICPVRDTAVPPSKPHIRLSSPPPPMRRVGSSPKVAVRSHRGSDSTVRDGSPKAVRKVSSAIRARPSSVGSDIAHSEATRFHEFASSEEEVDDWTQESTCYKRPLTVDDTLSIELSLRKLGREVEEEEEDEDEDEDDDADDGVDDDEDEDSDEEGSNVLEMSAASSKFESDDGFQTDDEHGFGSSDGESDGDLAYDWWAPGRATGEQVEHIRPHLRRTASDVSSESGTEDEAAGIYPGLKPGRKIRHKGSRPLDVQTRPAAPELPDSTDFVCGTLDEDKPLEHAYLSALELRRAAKHRLVPQDIDPSFPTSDPELDEDEEDEVSDHEVVDSDHPIFLHGHMEPHDDSDRKSRGKKRSPLGSPKRLRSPPPPKRVSTHRSPPPLNRRHGAHSPRRMRSPAPYIYGRDRLSSSVPKNDRFKTRNRFHLPDEDDDDAGNESTPRFLPERRAIDIVKGLEKKRLCRHEKLLERHARKVAKPKPEKKHQPGKGAERMREMGLELNAYRGRKPVAPQQTEEVHMLSY